MAFAPIHIERIHTVAIPRAEVWRLLSETDHLNRVIGLFPVTFADIQSSKKGPYRKASAKVWNLVRIAWREYPFQWIEQKEHVVERLYESGPLLRFLAGIELFDAVTETGEDGTQIRFFADVTPRNVLGYVATHLVGSQSMRNTIAYLRQYLTARQQMEATIRLKRPQTSKRHSANVEEMDRMLARLHEFPIQTSYLPILRRVVMEHDDDEVTSIRPYEFARDYELDERETLRLFLYATKVGMFNLDWNMMCPNCRVSKAQAESLVSVSSSFHCDFCGIEYETNFDQSVELRFTVHPTVRKASGSIYCIGGPGITPHVLIQRCIEGHGFSTITIPHTETSRLRIRTLQTNDMLSCESFGGTDEIAHQSVDVHYNRDGWDVDMIRLGTAGTTVAVYNDCEDTIVVDVERTQWRDDAVTAAEVTAMQEFRDLFSSEVLSPGQQVGVQNVTIFFTDLRGSTAMYEHIGDASAYGHVRKHFDYLMHHIASHSGSMVKTIGDAVMAVFHHPYQAVQAALDIQGQVDELIADIGEPLTIKIGIHTGPAIAVNSNDRLDYFGRTVNIAARVQGCSRGGDIVVTEQVYLLPEVQRVMNQTKAIIEPFTAKLKGIDADSALVRVNLTNDVYPLREMALEMVESE